LDRCGVGFEVPASLAPIEPKFEACPRDLQFIVGGVRSDFTRPRV